MKQSLSRHQNVLPFWFVFLALLSFAPLAHAGDCQLEKTFDLPYGEKMSFCAIWLNLGDSNNVFDARPVDLGDLDGGSDFYAEQQYRTRLSGSFTGERDGKEDWYYYLGKTEITRAQYNAVVRWDYTERKKLPPPVEDRSKLPQTSVSAGEVFAFIDALNAWLLSQQKDKLPKWRSASGFCRLPTEGEWEFAARGGIETYGKDRNVFNRPTPYEKGTLGEYERYQSNASKDNGGLIEAGSLNSNPCGIHDMLGNVQELTINLFGPNYHEGRFGNFAVRGGSAKSNGPDDDGCDNGQCDDFAKASQRREYRGAHDKTGFRLAMSNRISDVLDMNFEKAFAESCEKNPGACAMDGGTVSQSPTVQHDQDASAQYKTTIEQARLDIDKLEREKRDLRSKLQKSEADQEKAEAEVSALKKKCDNQALSGDQDAAGKDMTRLRRDLADKEAELARARQRADAASGEKDVLEKELERKNKELTALREQSLRYSASFQQASGQCDADLAQLKSQIENLRADNQSKDAKLLTSRQERARLEDDLAAARKKSADLDAAVARLERDMQIAKGASAAKPETDKSVAGENALLRRTIAESERDYADLQSKLNRLLGEKGALEQSLAAKDQEIADARRLTFNSVRTLDKSGERLRYSEAQYLEALMHEASALASLTVYRLRKLQIVAAHDPGVLDQKTPKIVQDEAREFLSDYCFLIRKIVGETNPDLFVGVKTKLIRDGQGFSANEQRRRRQALEYIADHVAKTRSGGPYPKPDELFDTILKDPAFAQLRD
jgi:hypothetical protein